MFTKGSIKIISPDYTYSTSQTVEAKYACFKQARHGNESPENSDLIRENLYKIYF